MCKFRRGTPKQSPPQIAVIPLLFFVRLQLCSRVRRAGRADWKPAPAKQNIILPCRPFACEILSGDDGQEREKPRGKAAAAEWAEAGRTAGKKLPRLNGQRREGLRGKLPRPNGRKREGLRGKLPRLDGEIGGQREQAEGMGRQGGKHLSLGRQGGENALARSGRLSGQPVQTLPRPCGNVSRAFSE